MGNKSITKHNSLIEASYRLTLDEQRLILACIAQVVFWIWIQLGSGPLALLYIRANGPLPNPLEVQPFALRPVLSFVEGYRSANG